MISREQIESILKINGVSVASPDEQIRSVLLSARYNHDEVDAAIMVLREDTKTKQTRVDGLHKVFRTNDGLNPAEISELLGITVDASRFVDYSDTERSLSVSQVLMIALTSLLIAVLGIFLYLYGTHGGTLTASVSDSPFAQPITN